MRKWYEMEACNQGPIIGGQVYLVRNIMGYPFEAKMNEEEQKALMAAVCYAVRQSEEVLQKKFVFINFSEVRDYEQQALIDLCIHLRKLVTDFFIRHRNNDG